jgi:acetate kinase
MLIKTPKLITINVGSSNIKYAVFQNQKRLDSGKVSNIRELMRILDSRYELSTIIHRVVFAPLEYAYVDGPITVDVTFLAKMQQYNSYAPLHNPRSLEVMEFIKANYWEVKQYAVFDSAFHHTNSSVRTTIPLPKEITEKLGLKKYGYHGLSYQYIVQKYQELKKTKEFSIICCHLGAGSSVCAIKDGKSVATSMGFGTEEGLMMVKRTGDLGANTALFLQDKLNLNTSEVRNMIYNESGFMGLTGTDDVELIASSSNPDCQLAISVFVEKVVDYIGSYYFLLEGKVDTIIFAGGIGENSSIIRELIKEKLTFLKDQEYMVIKTDEQEMMLKGFIGK